MATTKKTALDPKMTCRGRWSVCGGTEPSISAKWHLGADCTKKRADQMKAAKAEVEPPKAKDATKVAVVKPSTPTRKPAPRTSAPIQRVAATAAPVPTITKAEQDAERAGDRNN